MKTKSIVTTWGTCHFPSTNAAVRYYQSAIDPSYTVAQILEKVKSKEIIIGRPTTKQNQIVLLHPKEERYYVQENA